MKDLLSGLAILIIIIWTGCTTYTIPISSFRSQFGNMDSSELEKVTVRGPLGEHYSYKTFNKDTVWCLKDGSQTFLLKKPSLEVRITQKNGKKTIFYFDLMYVNNNKVYGSQSRFIKFFNKEICIDSISKIEIQDGKKNFKYVN